MVDKIRRQNRLVRQFQRLLTLVALKARTHDPTSCQL